MASKKHKPAVCRFRYASGSILFVQCILHHEETHSLNDSSAKSAPIFAGSGSRNNSLASIIRQVSSEPASYPYRSSIILCTLIKSPPSNPDSKPAKVSKAHTRTRPQKHPHPPIRSRVLQSSPKALSQSTLYLSPSNPLLSHPLILSLKILAPRPAFLPCSSPVQLVILFPAYRCACASFVDLISSSMAWIWWDSMAAKAERCAL